MVELDFSPLEKLAYRGFDTDDEKAKKDKLISQGFTIIEDEETPFESNEKEKPSASIKEKKTPFMSVTGINYNELYRAAHDFHERHYPPSPDLEYWIKTSRDMGETAAAFGNPTFLIGLLKEIFDELERETKS